VLVIDDTAIPKKGTHSVGVAAPYASALGKTDAAADPKAKLRRETSNETSRPPDTWLYSPQPRMADRCRTVRRREEEVTNLHRTKVQSIGHTRFRLPGNGSYRQLPTRREPNIMTICNR